MRQRKGPEDYPETQEAKCLRCGEVYTAYRETDRGSIWYTDRGEHTKVCPERDKASPSDTLNKWLRS